MTGQDVASIRRKLGLTQTRLAEELGLTLRTIQRLEALEVVEDRRIELSMVALTHREVSRQGELVKAKG